MYIDGVIADQNWFLACNANGGISTHNAMALVHTLNSSSVSAVNTYSRPDFANLNLDCWRMIFFVLHGRKFLITRAQRPDCGFCYCLMLKRVFAACVLTYGVFATLVVTKKRHFLVIFLPFLT